MRGRHLRRRTVPVLTVALVLAVATVAWAVVIILGGISGEIGRASVGVEATDAALVESQTGCAGVTVTDGDIVLTFPNALVGEYCRFTATWLNSGSRSVRLQGTNAPIGATVSLGTEACGLTLDPDMSASIETTVTLDEGVGPVTFDSAVDGLLWVPTQGFDPSLC